MGENPSTDGKATNKRLSAIFRPEWNALDFIEIPTGTWYLTEDRTELYEHDNGVFIAHPMIEESVFHTWGTKKVISDSAIEVEVECAEDCIYVTTEPCSFECRPTVSYQVIDDPEKMNKKLIIRNKRHLNQMNIDRRIPTRPDFKPILQNQGTSDVADEILNGTYDPSSLGLGVEMEEFIKTLRMTPEEKKLNVRERMSREDYQDIMKITKEDTSSSPSGLHYTLWKAAAENDDLAEIHSLWQSLPFMYGFLNKRWLKTIECMLEKKTGVRKIHMMRIINLFEADFSTQIKYYFNRGVMPNAEQTRLSSNQHGGRPNHSAEACAMNKLATWEWAR